MFTMCILRREGPIDLDAKFEPSLLNTAIYLLGLSQQVSTFAINYQGRPFREGIRENRFLYYGLIGASAVAFSGSTNFMPEFNRWLQIVDMSSSVRHSPRPNISCYAHPCALSQFMFQLTTTMVVDFLGCYVIEVVCKYLFADLEPKPLITRGSERRIARRQEEARLNMVKELDEARAAVERKAQ